MSFNFFFIQQCLLANAHSFYLRAFIFFAKKSKAALLRLFKGKQMFAVAVGIIIVKNKRDKLEE